MNDYLIAYRRRMVRQGESDTVCELQRSAASAAYLARVYSQQPNDRVFAP